MDSLVKKIISGTAIGIWLGSVLALGGIGLGRAISITSRSSNPPDFANYYLAGRMLSVSPTSIYDQVALDNLTKSVGVPGWASPYGYPPFFAVFIRLWSWLPYPQAITAWKVFNIVCLLSGMACLLAYLGWPWKVKGAAIAFLALILFPPAQENILLGQVNSIIFLLSSLIFLVVKVPRKRGWEFYAGLLAGLAASIKIFPAIIVVYFLFRKRWWGVLGGIISGFLCQAIGVFWGGGWLNSWTYFTNYLFKSYVGRMAYFQIANQSLTAMFMRPMGDESLARILGILSIGLVLFITWMALRNNKLIEPDIEFSLIVFLPLLVLTGVYSHYFILLLIPFAVLIKLWLKGKSWIKIPLLTAFLLLILNSYSEWINIGFTRWLPVGLVATLTIWITLIYIIVIRKPVRALE